MPSDPHVSPYRAVHSRGSKRCSLQPHHQQAHRRPDVHNTVGATGGSGDLPTERVSASALLMTFYGVERLMNNSRLGR